jgi:hypothetical protein
MNVGGIDTDSTTLAKFIETAIPFTAVTIWVLVAIQIESETLSSLRQLFRKSINKSSERGVALEPTCFSTSSSAIPFHAH